ncbi:MAG: Zinc ribbon domain protein [Gemmataceae bacterium]|nr:Zinc ribbon domain protein [Gemmataceae bacterium]
MPTYDYECRACGHRFEELQSFSEPPLTKCPACKKNKLERLFGGGGAIIFKGSGFYETDYRRAGDVKTNGDAKTNGTADADTGAAKTETKAETKSESANSSADTSAPAGGSGSAGKSGSKGSAKKGK